MDAEEEVSKMLANRFTLIHRYSKDHRIKYHEFEASIYMNHFQIPSLILMSSF